MPNYNGPPRCEEPAPPQDRHLPKHLECTDSIALTVPIVTLAWRYKDAAKEQAKRGLITWAQFRAYCAEVDRIKRSRLSEARDAARIPSAAEVHRGGQSAATEALMRTRHTGNVEKDLHLDRERKSGESARAIRQAEICTSLLNAPELSDSEHSRRVGVTDKTVAACRRRLEESSEIPIFLRRVDPRTGRQSQPARRSQRRTSVSREQVAL